MIPDEAVEAAARAYRHEFPYDENNEHIVKLVLEAAAPYMLKQGWDEGYKAGLFDKEYYSHNRNPYMLNNEGEK